MNWLRKHRLILRHNVKIKMNNTKRIISTDSARGRGLKPMPARHALAGMAIAAIFLAGSLSVTSFAADANRTVLIAPTAAVIDFPQTAGASSYELEIQVSEDGGYRDITPDDGIKTSLKNVNTDLYGTNGITEVLTGLKPSTSYKIKVRAAGKTVQNPYTEAFAVKTPAAGNKTAAALVGKYISYKNGDFITLNKNGKATIDFGGENKGLYRNKNLSYSATADKNGKITATLISSDGIFKIEKSAGAGYRLTLLNYPGNYLVDDTLVKTTANNAKTPVSGTFVSTDYNKSAPSITFNEDGTGTAKPSGAVSGEKPAKFTYERRGTYLTLKFSSTPDASLLGLTDDMVKGTVEARIYSGVTAEKAYDNNYTKFTDKTGNVVDDFIVNADRDISSDTPADYIAFGNGLRDGVFCNFVYTTGTRE